MKQNNLTQRAFEENYVPLSGEDEKISPLYNSFVKYSGLASAVTAMGSTELPIASRMTAVVAGLFLSGLGEVNRVYKKMVLLNEEEKRVEKLKIRGNSQ